MNNCLTIKILLSLVFLSLQAEDYPNLYTPFERDAIIIIDWGTEPLSTLFGPIIAPNTAMYSSAIQLLNALYISSAPIITTASNWESIIARADILSQALMLSDRDFYSYLLNKYGKNPAFASTFISNQTFIYDLYYLCRTAHNIYQEVNMHIAQDLTESTNLESLATVITSKIQPIKFTHSMAQQLFSTILYSLLPCYSIIEKMKKEKESWIFRKANDCTYVLIPKSYIEGIKKQVPESNDLEHFIKDHISGRSLTLDEIKLGIKFEGLETINLLEPIQAPDCSAYTNPSVNPNFINKISNTKFTGALTRIFVTSEDLTTVSEDQLLKSESRVWIPQYIRWNIYAFGHGTPQGQMMTGFSSQTFNHFLDFFNTINTRFLYYTSCFAGGETLRSNFINQQKKELKNYSYIIVIGAIQEASTTTETLYFGIPPLYNITGAMIDKKTRTLMPSIKIKYAQFFNDLHALVKTTPSGGKKPLSYKEILSHLINFTSESGYVSDTYNSANIPQIKFPGSSWFHVIDIDNTLIRLTPTFVRTKEAEIATAQWPEDKQLTISNKKILLLDAGSIWDNSTTWIYNKIPFPVEIIGTMPIVISMGLGNVFHYWPSIITSSLALTDVLQKFWGVPGTKFSRYHSIDHLNVQNDLTPALASYIGAKDHINITLKNVLILANVNDPIFNKPNQYGIIFQAPNNQWYASLFSLENPIEANRVKEDLANHDFPYLITITDVNIIQSLINQNESIKKNLETIRQSSELSLEKVAKFTMTKADHIKLVKQYEEIKKVSEQALNKWKTTLTPEELELITNYEEMQKARP